MTAAGSGPVGARHDETGDDRRLTADLAEMLPAPAERDLPPAAHRYHKDRLMRFIDHDGDTGTAPAADPAPARTRRLPLRRSTLWLPAAALALAGALTVGLVTGGNGDDGSGPARAGHGAAGALLDRIANAAAEKDVAPVRDGQLVYVKSLTAGAEGRPDGTFEPGELHEREVWMSQRRGPVEKLGLIHEDGSWAPLTEMVPPGSPGVREGVDRPTYRWLATLPTDPDALLRKLDGLAEPGEGQERDQAVFELIGRLLGETVMPPETASALYRAAARIPGVTRTEDAVDAAGRHGIAVTRVDKKAATATSWIFDKRSLAYLGELSRLSKDTKAGKKGTVLEETAVLRRGVVDGYRQRPDGDRTRHG
ncbi:CU044_5270 family protein [Streptomyces albus]|uniref:CU044_5270 family protein n=1 Tax=Streptomyces albus TaxID=1888 RepID=UPI0024AD0AD8|nr:CU044_5270 family protein [Streptomyces albus]MDI6409934.1 CU044_5270 family protein [Streptomyces albus]